MPLTRTQTQGIAWLAIGLLAVLALWLLGPVLTPFAIAAVLGYVLNPLVDRLAARMPRSLAALLVEMLAIVVLLAVVLLIVPILIKELPTLRNQVPVLLTRLDALLTPLLTPLGVTIPFDIAGIKDLVLGQLGDNTETWMRTALDSLRIGGSFVLGVAGAALLLPVVLFYMLADWHEFLDRAHRLVPPRMRPSVESFATECDQMLSQYLRGQLLVMVILAVFYSVGLTLFGFDLALPVGSFTGLAVFIPYVGFGLGLVLATLIGLLQFGPVYTLVAIAVVYGIGQVLESFFLTPRLVGERIGLHPVAVIFALLAFGQLFGFIGVLIALPVSAIGAVAFRRVKSMYLASPLYRG